MLGGRAGAAPHVAYIQHGGGATPRVTVGVDVGKGSHQAAGFDPAADRVVGPVSFTVSRAGFKRFRLCLERLAPDPTELLVGLEATGADRLNEQGADPERARC